MGQSHSSKQDIDLQALAGREGPYYAAGARFAGGKLVPARTLPWYLDTDYFKSITRLACLRNGQSALDVNTGNPISGVTAIYLKHAAPEARVVALDKSAEILAQASDNARVLGVDGIDWTVGYEEALTFPDCSFDVVVDRLGFHHNERPWEAASEIHRVLQPGGRFILADIIMPADPDSDRWLNATYKTKSPHHVKWYTQHEIDIFFTTVGFQEVERVPWTLPMRMDELGWTNRELRDQVQSMFEAAPGRARKQFRIQGTGDELEFTVDMIIAAYMKNLS